MPKIDLTDNARQIDQMVELLDAQGYALASIARHFDSDSNEVRDFLDSVLRQIAFPIQVFDQYPAWRPIGVRLDREPTRSQGIGASPLHIDFVNAANPPDVVALLCERGDPRNGGASLLAPSSVVDSLPESARKQLAQPVYRDGRVAGLHNIGEDINPFPVFRPEDSWRLRYTGQLVNAELKRHQRDAIRMLDEALHSRATTFILEPGDVIFIDQHKILHGRKPLGAGQGELGRSETRLLWQRFGRFR